MKNLSISLTLFTITIVLTSHCINAYTISYCSTKIIFPTNFHKCFQEKHPTTKFIILELEEDENENVIQNYNDNSNLLTVLVKKMKDYESENSFTHNKKSHLVIRKDTNTNKFYCNDEGDEVIKVRLVGKHKKYIKATYRKSKIESQYRFLQKNRYYDIYYESMENDNESYLLKTLNEKVPLYSNQMNESNEIELYNPNLIINA